MAIGLVALGVFIGVWSLRWLLAEHDIKLDISILLLLILRSVSRKVYESVATDLFCKIAIGAIAIPGLIYFAIQSFSVLLNRNKTSGHAEGPQPYICPSRTTHTRLFPKKHRFAYSYLLIAVPVGWKGAIGSMLSIDADAVAEETINRSRACRQWTWMKLQASDYLFRGDGHLGLEGKLRQYLKSQGELLDDYTSAWLVTAPRFLGYSFNPVSFWYLYNGNKLGAMVLEVNNTFDERRMYFMKNDALALKDKEEDSKVSLSEAPKFTNRWEKDFHVSPFNSRKGSYSLSAQDPRFINEVAIDNTITLNSSKHHAKIFARIYSTGPALQPSRMSFWSKVRFVTSWFWVGFMTFPRIVKEAAKLFFRKGLHVWYRPEVLRSSVSRHESARERAIEACFCAQLRVAAQKLPLAAPIRYTVPESTGTRVEIFQIPTSSSVAETSIAIDFRVLTPQFFTDVAASPDPIVYMTSQHLRPEKEHTFYTSHTHVISTLFSSGATPPAQEVTSSAPGQWRLLSMLRSSQDQILDRFARTHLSEEQAEAYRGAVMSLLISKYIAFGIPEILDAIVVMAKVWLCYTCFGALLTRLENSESGSDITLRWVVGVTHLWFVGEEIIRRRRTTRLND